MNSRNVRNSDVNMFRSEGRATTYFVFRESGVIGIPFPLVSSPTEDACLMVNSAAVLLSSSKYI